MQQPKGLEVLARANSVTLRLYGDVGLDILASETAKALEGAQGKPVAVHIFSYGGSAGEALAIYNILKAHKGSVETLIDGIAASAGGLIFMAGDKRKIPSNSLLHLHSVWGSASGPAEEMRSKAEMFEVHSTSYRDIYASTSGQSVEQIDEWMKASGGSGTWFTAAEAEAAGFATELTDAVEISASTRADVVARFPVVASLIGNSGHKTFIVEPPDNQEAMATSANAAEAATVDPTVTPQTIAAPQAAVSAPAAAASDPRAEIEALKRENNIRACAAHTKIAPEKIEELIASGKPFEKCAAEIIQLHAAATTEAPNASKAGHPAQMNILRDQGDKLMEGIQDAIWAKIKPSSEPTEAARPYKGLRAMEIIRLYADSRGINTLGRSPHELIPMALHVSDDLPNVFGTAANRSMMTGYAEEVHRWEAYCRRRDLTDFRPTNDVFVTGSLDLIKVNQGEQSDKTKIDARMEGSEYQMATVSDGKTSWRLDKFTRGLRISEEALINDDLSALDGLPEMFGRGARRVQANTIYGLITGNSVVSMDNQVLFHASHNNTGAGLLNIEGLNTGFLKFATQKDNSGNPLELEPDFLLAPAALRGTGLQVIGSMDYVPNQLSGNAGPNPYAGALQPIYSSRLDSTSTTQWYLIAGPSKVEGITYGFLQGESGPSLTTTAKRSPDCLEFLCRMYFGATIKDWRFIYRASGVA
jgi:ATP-dependent protease ClpP protease subunit